MTGPLPAASAARARFDTIYAAIRERISLLDHAPGQRLSEEVLAREFGTSRTPVRRVLARLEDEGLVRSVQGVGTIVTDVDLRTLEQTYGLRMELAQLIGRLDPVRPGDAVLGRMRAVAEALEALQDAPDPRSFARLNIEFFHAIIALTANEPFAAIVERIYYQTARIWIRDIGDSDLDAEIAIFGREVSDILAATELGDLKAVGDIRRAHVSMSLHRRRGKTRTGGPGRPRAVP